MTLPKHRFAASSPAGVTDAHADPKVRQFSLFSTCAIAVLFLILDLTVLSGLVFRLKVLGTTSSCIPPTFQIEKSSIYGVQC